MAKLSNLDGIRAIAVLLVVVSHLLLQLSNGTEPAGYSWRTMGRVGVAIFFVHTTLVLMASLERHGPAAIPFYLRRFFRIYPLSVAIVLLFALLQIAAHVPVDSAKLLSNLFLVQNLTGHASFPRPLWSLPYEVQMYLVLPLLYWLTRTRRPLAWLALVYAWALLMAAALPSASLAAKLLRYVPCFLPGVLAFALARRVQSSASPLLLFALVGVGGVAGVPALVAAGVPEMPLLWGLCFAIGAVIPACRQMRDGVLARGAHLTAKYSYGIYITHVLAMGAIDGLVPGPAIVQWAAMLVLLPGLAYISYHGIEKHGVALGAHLAERWVRRSAGFGLHWISNRFIVCRVRLRPPVKTFHRGYIPMTEAKMVASRPLLDRTRITLDMRALLLLLSIAGLEGLWTHFANIELIDVSAALFLIVIPLSFGLILELAGFAKRLAQISNYLSLWLGKIVVGSTFSYLCTTLAFPLLDAKFSRIDSALGFHWIGWFEFVQAHSTLHKALALAYVSLIPQTFIAVVFFSHAARTARARELWWTTIMSLLICCVVSGFLPALGAYPYHQMESPEVAEILSLRSGATQCLSVLMVKGLIAFPSFHMVGVILLSYVYRYSKLFPLVASLNGLMMISLPTQGGHYLIDMIGGAFVATFAIFAYHRWIGEFGRGDKYRSDRRARVVSAAHDSDKINDAIRALIDR